MLAVVLWGISTIAFLLLHLSGDPAALLLTPDAPPGAAAILRHTMGLDAPLPVQYARFMRGVLRGDFGVSLRQQLPALRLVIERLPATVELAMTAILVAMAVGVPLGTLAALRRGTLRETGLLVVALFGQSVPDFWLALMLILVFGVMLNVLPVSGRGGVTHLILPAVTLSVEPMARIARALRSSLLDELHRDYTRTARSKGLAEFAVITRHVLRNAAIPVATLIGLDFGRLLGGAVIVETVFAWPGVGRLAVNAVLERDFPVVQTAVVVVGVGFVLVNFLLDVLYVWLNPQITFDAGS